ncbi:MAG: thiolase family protein [Desulfitobacteriaceae bacterium]|nr:thiolase family protein [Desulfitobacteriaceae bacterium]MDD4346370.1 thiolase family protein [Desulfitobacteriaceae bacterium]MDD4401514.1 thiolase family protein [Desulfitobacteriaceae bacterium]
MRDVVIVSAVRTPFGKFVGGLKDIPIVEVGKTAIQGAIERAGIKAEEVEEVYYGNCLSAEAETPSVIGRQISLKAGIRPEVMTVTVDTACCSSLLAVRLAYQSIANGTADVVVAGGVESMSRAAFLLPPNVRWGHKIGPIEMQDWMFGIEYKGYNPVSVDAGNVAVEYGVTREEQDLWALRSQQNYAKALAEGKFKDEIIPIQAGDKVIDSDELPRPDSSIEKLAKLKTVFGSPTVTAGNAPPLSDGATAMIVMSADMAKSLGLKPMGKIKAALGRSTKPNYIATIPGIAIKECLQQAGLTLDDIDLIEINEAFAAMPLVSSLIMAEGDIKKLEEIRNKINIKGGAIAIGHPIGASGARILMTLLYELIHRGGGKGVAAICGGLAQGETMIIEV